MAHATALLAIICLASAGAAWATPGNAWFALSPAPSAGDLDADAYLSTPALWPALAAEHDRGWAVAYRSASPPAGWDRAFVLRGGGAACSGGVLRPGFAAALHEMLPARESALLALLDPPDSAACSSGKPNPHPFERDGWLGLHDGRLDVEAATMQIWRADLGPDWEAFTTDHPRDFHAKGDSTRGNAGEICFLLFLYELSHSPDDVPTAIAAAIDRLRDLQSYWDTRLNLVFQSPAGTWVVRYTGDSPNDYRIFYGRTTRGEYWIADAIPAGVVEWDEVPNRALACFPAGGLVEIRDLYPGAVDDQPDADGDGTDPHREGLALWTSANPSRGEIHLGYRVVPMGAARLELLDVAGRRVMRTIVAGPFGRYDWVPPTSLPAGVYMARLRSGSEQAGIRILWLR